jgi:protein TonB
VSAPAAVPGIRLPFALSVLGHAILLLLLVLFARGAPPLPLPQQPTGVTVAIVPSVPQPAAPPVPTPPPQPKPRPPEPKPPPKPPKPQPPPPPPPVPPPEAPAIEAPPLPPQKPPVPPVRRVVRRPEPRRVFAPPPIAAPQPAAPAPARAPAPVRAISPGYRALLGAWLERHKRYPESARERGEEGRVMLQFTVDRDGRVANAAVVSSSGASDLDAAVLRMMQGAVLPPFPPDMPQMRIEVRVPIDFSLAR